MKNIALFLAVAAMVAFSAACTGVGTAAAVGGFADEANNQGMSQYQDGSGTATTSLVNGQWETGGQSYHANGSDVVRTNTTIEVTGTSTGFDRFGEMWNLGLFAVRGPADTIGSTKDDDGDGNTSPSLTSIFAAGFNTASAETGNLWGADTYNGDNNGSQDSAYYDASVQNNDRGRVNSKGGQGIGGLSYSQLCALLQTINPGTDATTSPEGIETITVDLTGVTVNGARLDLEAGDLPIDVVLKGTKAGFAWDSSDPANRMVASWVADRVDEVRARGDEPEYSFEINGQVNLTPQNLVGDNALVINHTGDSIRKAVGLE